MQNHQIKINNITISNDLPFVLIAGPCQLESMEHSLFLASELKKITTKLGIPYIFKASFDKANRTSLKGKRGLGLEKSLEIFSAIKEKYDIPVITDVHESHQCEIIAKVVDILQIPAFLCRQTDLLVAAAKTGKVINAKKGQFLAPWDMENVAAKIKESGNPNVLLTERGASFGYNNLVVDMRSLPIMAKTGLPVVFDATHSVQKPGGLGDSTGGDREFVPPLAKAAISIGIAGLFMETHEEPSRSPSDGPNMIALKDMEKLLTKLQKLDKIAKEKE